jgi:hypothetical protein
MDFFLIASAFLTTAYVTSFPSSPRLALAAAAVGVLISFAFNRMELRSRGLVKRGEEALAPLEARLAEILGTPSLCLVQRAEKSILLTSYAKVFGLLHWLAFLGFGVGVIVAAVSSLQL